MWIDLKPEHVDNSSIGDRKDDTPFCGCTVNDHCSWLDRQIVLNVYVYVYGMYILVAMACYV